MACFCPDHGIEERGVRDQWEDTVLRSPLQSSWLTLSHTAQAAIVTHTSKLLRTYHRFFWKEDYNTGVAVEEQEPLSL